MTLKEITNLRKSGNLEEALEAAEDLFNNKADKYSAGALIYCLNDLCKNQDLETSKGTFERMRHLSETYCQDDEYIQRVITATSKRLVRNKDVMERVKEQAKNGDNQAYSEIDELYANGNLDRILFNDYGWVIYYTLKCTNVTNVNIRKQLLARYLDLNLERPSLLHSQILSEAIKTEKNTPLQFRFRDFLQFWGLDNLCEDDWEQYRTNDGNTLPSLVEKLIGVYVKEMKDDGVTPTDDFIRVLDEALEKFPNNQNMPYFKATTLISQGEKEEAIKYYKDLIMKFPSKFYLWDQASSLVEEEDIKIGLLCKAISMAEDERFIGGVRLRLASILMDKGLYSNAKYELDKYRQTYDSNGWHLKPEFEDVADFIPKNTPSIIDNLQLYNQYYSFAEEFIYSALPSTYVIKISDNKVEHRHHPGRRYVQWRLKSEDKTYILKKPNKYGLDSRASNGTIFEAKIKDDKIVWIKISQNHPTLNWIKTVSGEIRLRQDRNEKNYTLIKGVYVDGNLIRQMNDGDNITILAYKQDDGRWKAISVTNSD